MGACTLLAQEEERCTLLLTLEQQKDCIDEHARALHAFDEQEEEHVRALNTHARELGTRNVHLQHQLQQLQQQLAQQAASSAELAAAAEALREQLQAQQARYHAVEAQRAEKEREAGALLQQAAVLRACIGDLSKLV